jgi:methanogenic corrinoid protein MtbC1
MFTIKHAVEITGLAAGTLRAWEQRYGIGRTERTESGYRVYDQRAIDEIMGMQKLVDQGWTHHEAAKAILSGAVVPVEETATFQESSMHVETDSELSSAFLSAARVLDEEKLGALLDIAFSRGSFESVIDAWLVPTLRLLGEEWVAGRMDIASEHFASSAIMRRLGTAFEGSAVSASPKKVLVGNPAGSFHEIGTLALAVALRRRGVGVIYLGNNVPAEAWVEAVNGHGAVGAIVSVMTDSDISPTQEIVNEIKARCKGVSIVVGGPCSEDVVGATLVAQGSITNSARTIADIFKK